jgi:LacI family transcriptional regulator
LRNPVSASSGGRGILLHGGVKEGAAVAVTMADVARRAKTSVAVVSYVLNDGPRPVAAATRARVLAAATDLGYRRDRVAAALRSGSSGLIGLVLPDPGNPYFATLGRRLEEALARAGRLTVVANSGYDPHRQADAIEKFLAARVDGVIIVSAAGAGDPAGVARAAGTPVVYVHHRPHRSPTALVAADHTAAVSIAAEHLREHGYDRVALLAGLTDAGPAGAMVAAWRGELLRGECTREAAARLTEDLAAQGRLPRGLVTATDEQAIGVLAAAARLGHTVPDRLAIVSCDGSPDTGFTVPALTVVEQPLTEMARHAVRRLLREPDTAPGSLRARLVVRRSCGCPGPDAN